MGRTIKLAGQIPITIGSLPKPAKLVIKQLVRRISEGGGNSARGHPDLAGLFLHPRFFDPPERERLVSDDS
jgi:hypothetical protein